MLPFEVNTRQSKDTLEDKALVILARDQVYVKISDKLHCCDISSYLADVEKVPQGLRLSLFTRDTELSHSIIGQEGIHDDISKGLSDISEILLKQRINSLGTIRKDGKRFYHVSFDGKDFNNDGTVVILDDNHSTVDINQFRSGINCVSAYKDKLVVACRNKTVYAYDLFDHRNASVIEQFSSQCRDIKVQGDNILLINDDYSYVFDESFNHSETYGLKKCVSSDGQENCLIADESSVYEDNGNKQLKKIVEFGWAGKGRKISFIGRLDTYKGLLGLTNGDYFAFDFREKQFFERSDEIYQSPDFELVLSLESETGKTNNTNDYVKKTFLRKF